MVKIIGITVKAIGLNKAIKNNKHRDRNVYNSMDDIAMTAANTLVDILQGGLPVKTGELVDSTFAESIGHGHALVFVAAPHARVIDEGRPAVHPTVKKALWWEGAEHPVGRVSAVAGNEFTVWAPEELKSEMEGIADVIINNAINV